MARRASAQVNPSGPRWPAHKVELWDIAKVKPYSRNTRLHGKEQIEQIRASMRQFGWTIPVLVREDGTVIAGHGRLAAGKVEGYKQVPVIIAAGWTDAQCRAYGIADNRLTETSSWDKELLKLELGELATAGVTPISVGFTDADLKRLKVTLDDVGGAEQKAPGELKSIIQFNIVFDDAAQQEAWFGFVRRLKAKYPQAETLGARLAAFIAEASQGAAG